MAENGDIISGDIGFEPPLPGVVTAVFWLAYAAVCYMLFFGAIVYLVGFVLDLVVPKSLDSGTSPGSAAMAVDAALFLSFGVQHSVMARPGFKARLTRLVPTRAERSTYILASVMMLTILMAAWQPLPAEIWHLSGIAAVVVYAIALGGLATLFLATFMIDHFEFAGLRQPWNHVTGRPPVELPFTQRMFYRYVRHPIMLGFLLLFWVTPHMTVGHLVFAALATVYIAVGVHFEERGLGRAIGPAYDDYRKRVPAVFPLRLRRG